MRKAKREIKEFADIVAVMRRCDVCRLGIVDDGGAPYVVPLNFGLEAAEGKVTLYFHSALEGHKLDLLARNPHVGFEMDCDHKLQYFSEKCYCTMAYASVMGKGTVRMTKTPTRRCMRSTCSWASTITTMTRATTRPSSPGPGSTLWT